MNVVAADATPPIRVPRREIRAASTSAKGRLSGPSSAWSMDI
jgi:hypothetical protein